MSFLNIGAEEAAKLFKGNNDKYAKRATDIIRAGEISMNLQLVKDFIAMQGLDLVADKEKIIYICKEIGVEPKAVGIEIEEQALDINKANIDMPQIDNDTRDEK